MLYLTVYYTSMHIHHFQIDFMPKVTIKDWKEIEFSGSIRMIFLEVKVASSNPARCTVDFNSMH